MRRLSRCYVAQTLVRASGRTRPEPNNRIVQRRANNLDRNDVGELATRLRRERLEAKLDQFASKPL